MNDSRHGPNGNGPNGPNHGSALTIVFAALALLATSPLLGQLAVEEFLEAHGDFAERAPPFTPAIQLSGHFMPDAEVKNERGDFDLYQWKADATVPLPISRDTFLITGVLGGARYYDFSSSAPVDNERLFNFGLRLGAGHFFTDDLSVQAFWQPSIYSDFDGTLKSGDWKLHYGTALSVYRVNDDFFLKAGFTLTDAFPSVFIPIGGFAWLFAEDWRLDLLAPRNLEVSYTPFEKLILQLGFEIEADAYRIRETVNGNEREKTIRVQEVRLFTGAVYRLTKQLSSFLKVGTTIAGSYDWGSRYDGTLDANLFVRTGVGWSF